MKRKRRVRKKKNKWKRRKKEKKGVEIQEKEEQLMINLKWILANEWGNWIETIFPPFLLCFCFSFLFYCLLHFRSGNLFFLFCRFFHQFLQILLHFCCFCWGRIWRNWWRNLQNRKKDCRIGNGTIEEEWKAETREKKEEEERERVKRKKMKTILSILICKNVGRQEENF